MYKLNITKNQFSDILNLFHSVFFPLQNFVSKKEFLQIIYNKKFGNNFYPWPIFFGVDKKNFLKIKDLKTLNLYYKKRYLFNIYDINFYDLNKSNISKIIYGKKFLKHPYYKKFINENYKFLTFKYKAIEQKNLKHKYFISPKSLKRIKQIKKISNLASFHTRNVPHKAHQWIHDYLYKKYGALLIQPLLGQYKKGEYKDDLILKTNKLAAKKFKSKKVFSIPFFSYPRYGGYREAALHALVRRNYGCSHFWIGRDHAGYKDFYNEKKSQIFCYKNQKKLKIKIVAGKEPYYCFCCKKIKNTKCFNKKCKKSQKKKISGTEIRNLLKKNKPIPKYLMSSSIAKYLLKNSIFV